MRVIYRRTRARIELQGEIYIKKKNILLILYVRYFHLVQLYLYIY